MTLYRRNPLSMTIIAFILGVTSQTFAQSIWINQVPGYASLAACAETRLSIIVRDMSSGCGASTSYACFCSTSYSTVNTIIASAVYSDCYDGADANSAVSVFAIYCNSSPVITISATSSNAQSTGIEATPASPSIAVSSATASSTSPAQISTLTTSLSSKSESISSSYTSSVALVSGGQRSTVIRVSGTVSPSSTCCANTNNQRPNSTSPSKGAIAGAVIAAIAVTACVMFGLHFTRYKARRNIRPGHPSFPRDSMQGVSEISPLLEKARCFRDTNPRTEESVKAEEDSLLRLIDIHNNLPETQERLLFDYKRGLVENAQDRREVSPAGQDLGVALAHCDDLVDISKRIYHDRPSALSLAQFYKGQILLTQARLVQLNGPSQEAFHRAKILYAEAFREFAAAVRLSKDLQVLRDMEVQKYRIRSLFACAFIVSQFEQPLQLESDLMAYPEYEFAKEILRTAHQDGKLLREMVKLDERSIRGLAA